MSDAKATQQEPSMEEILASIRRIISEDSDGGKPAAPAPAEAPPSEPDKGEVLELTEMVQEDGAVVDLKTPPPPPPEPLIPPPESPPVRVEPQPMINDEALISTPTAAASAAVLSNLRGFSRESDMRGQPLIGGGITVEELVRQEVRPMLREWLDQNLTALVERLVDREIRRLSREADQN